MKKIKKMLDELKKTGFINECLNVRVTERMFFRKISQKLILKKIKKMFDKLKKTGFIDECLIVTETKRLVL